MSDQETALSVKTKLDEKGRLISIINNNKSAIDPNKPWRKSGSDNFGEITTKAVFTSYKINEVDGDLVKPADKRVFVNAIDNQGKDISQYEAIIDGGVTWRIKRVEVIQPGDVIIMYKIQVRK